MSYYYRPSGDYSTGGYGGGMGDPGLLGFLGKLIKPIWKVARPFVGGVIGGVLGGVAAPGGGGAPGTAVVPAGTAPPAPPSFPGVGAVIGQAVGAGAVGAFRGASMGGVCPSGYHPAKDGSGRCVRNRRMNIANPRALRRSMRRVKGFEKLARKTISFTKRVRMK